MLVFDIALVSLGSSGELRHSVEMTEAFRVHSGGKRSRETAMRRVLPWAWSSAPVRRKPN